VTNQDSNWLSIREAALAAGVSELTIRRRIKDGKIPHRLVGGKYFVADTALHTSRQRGVPEAGTNHRIKLVPDKLSSHADRAPSARVSSQPDDQSPVNGTTSNDAPRLNLDALLLDYTRLAEIAGRATLLEEQLRQLQQQYAATQENTLALATRNGWLESKLEERDEAIKLLTDSKPRRSLWRRIFGMSDTSN
jgi:excisionase family DNA binding protein